MCDIRNFNLTQVEIYELCKNVLTFCYIIFCCLKLYSSPRSPPKKQSSTTQRVIVILLYSNNSKTQVRLNN